MLLLNSNSSVNLYTKHLEQSAWVVCTMHIYILFETLVWPNNPSTFIVTLINESWLYKYTSSQGKPSLMGYQLSPEWINDNLQFKEENFHTSIYNTICMLTTQGQGPQKPPVQGKEERKNPGKVQGCFWPAARPLQQMASNTSSLLSKFAQAV